MKNGELIVSTQNANQWKVAFEFSKFFKNLHLTSQTKLDIIRFSEHSKCDFQFFTEKARRTVSKLDN